MGEALVALHHDDLKSMGIASVGHRLTMLKSIFDVKKAQDIPIESDHYQKIVCSSGSDTVDVDVRNCHGVVLASGSFEGVLQYLSKGSQK